MPQKIVLSDQLAAMKVVADPAQQAALNLLQNCLDELLKPLPPARLWGLFKSPAPMIRGVYLYGGVGRGKSMLMDLFFSHVPDSIGKQRIHFHEFMIGVHDFLHQSRQVEKSGAGPDRALHKFADGLAADVRVLCFDEFHVTDVADAMILGRLFTMLFDRGLVVIATSNWPPEKLYEGGLQRDRFLPFISLVKERMHVQEIDGGKDYRLRHLTEDGVYFWPLGDHTREKMDKLFLDLTGRAETRSEEFHVKGRAIKVETVAKGVARFSFGQLCEQPLGAEDYLKIADLYHTIFLENVPRLTYDRRNEAKRLMTLIDALYDQGTKLVVSADATPDHLYRGHDHEFEFQRTVSRLLEMQSSAYIDKNTN
ncbi:MAG: cell division protein ZapE [Micavibrio sp.]